jgi:hypothetical protein
LPPYLRLPPPVLLGVVGVALGGVPAVMSEFGWAGGPDVFADAFARLPISAATFIYVFLPPLVFEAGIVTDVRRMIEDSAPILVLTPRRSRCSPFFWAWASPLANRSSAGVCANFFCRLSAAGSGDWSPAGPSFGWFPGLATIASPKDA